MARVYDVIIIGAGPSGLFAAKTLLENSNTVNVVLIEKGKAPDLRECNALVSNCKSCNYCSIVSGGGGAGLFSDGKLVLDLNSGGHLETMGLSESEKEKLVEVVQTTLFKFDGKSYFKDIPTQEQQDDFNRKLADVGLFMKYYKVLHMGTYNLRNISTRFVNYLIQEYGNRISFAFDTEVLDISLEKSGIFTAKTKESIYFGQQLILAAGKVGSHWLENVLGKMGCSFTRNRYNFGIRLETRYDKVKDLFDISLDPKIWREFSDFTKIKMHCACRNGKVIIMKYCNYSVVGGHTTYTEKNMQRDSTKSNFNILLSIDPTIIKPVVLLERFQRVGKGHLLVQRLEDFFLNQETQSYGNIRPDNENIVTKANIRELTEDIFGFPEKLTIFLKALNHISPGVADGDNLLYAPSVEWWMNRVNVDNGMQTSIRGLYAIGDGAGISQGIVHSAATGILAANKILYDLKDLKNEIS